jgi:uncharacterized protein YdeI (YjbR/CyaY-like superfamily)
MPAKFFKTAPEFRRWLQKNHATATELQVGFFKKAAGRAGLTYAEAIDEALCFGWIDGVLHRVDAESYALRFTPRRARSNWSKVNVARVERLLAAGKMEPAGLKAFAGRDEKKTGVYSFESPPRALPAAYAKPFRANKKAWAFFKAQAPWYQRLAIHKIVSPKQPATRARWLARIIAASAAGKRFQ